MLQRQGTTLEDRLTQQPVRDQVRADASAYRQQFETAQPFKHVVIENFFKPEFAQALLRDFPRFDPERAKNEFGEVGRKAVNERLEAISAAYATLSGYLRSEPFLQLMSELTGVPDLLPDPNLYGGGTHENLHGQELDPHIDFNYDPPTKMHRRLNLLVYLNEEWAEDWGGSIELHSNPRRPEENEVKAFLPIFNRALIFATNEYSWHGFPKIVLPEDRRHLSRKSLSIYLYTRTRPEHEIVPEHGTFYVQRPLPETIRPGHVLTDEDVMELKALLARRDGWIEHYQKTELRVSSQMGELNQRLAEKPPTGLREALANSIRFRWARLTGPR